MNTRGYDGRMKAILLLGLILWAFALLLKLCGLLPDDWRAKDERHERKNQQGVR